MFNHLVLDIGNVLSVWDPDALIASVCDDPAMGARLRAATIEHPDWLELDRGALSVADAVRRAVQRSDLDEQRVAALYEALPASLRAIDATHAAVEALHDRGVPLYVLSNMQHHAWSWLQANHSVYRLFDGCVISAEAGLIKPDPAIYAHLTERFGLEPAGCLFVDDMAVNVAAARAAGWQAEQLVDRDGGAALLQRLASEHAAA